ncbi:putative receptor-like serine/threonine-protein kinase At5g57670 isoform X1 [Silene latifolia]|uniref:putative receptor-like serine/threonine-protein kinase At5g57670 isoform X1 n=1 Tax=Silene latifolia TaxID=37657 RepID=UPI003D77D0B5
MKYIRSGSFKRLFSFGRRSTSSLEDSCFNEEDEDKPNYSQVYSLHSQPSQKPIWKCYSFDEIFVATNGFSPEYLVGKGGYAEVYKGKLKDGKMVAVKKLNKSSNEEKREREFLSEIGTIGHVYHPNVSSLLGCCIDNGLYLLFPFSPWGSVASLLHDASIPPMEWKVRYKIAVGTAKGLHYLHKGCQRRIIHRDVKASNILLTQDFEPQISDFGLAKWLPTQWSHHSIAPIEGTVGYLAPEYFSHGIVDEKTDVYAFGVLLLELISGRRPVDSSHQSLRTWAKPFLKRGDIEKLIDPRLGSTYDDLEIRLLAFIGSICIRSSTAWRPTMSEVLEIMMNGEIDKERWEMPEKEEQNKEELWDFEDLECEFDDTSSYSTTSLHDYSISTGSS